MITPSTIAAEITSETQLSATRAVVSGLRDRKHRRKPQAPRAPNTRGRIHDNPLGYDAVVVARPVHQRPPSSVRRLAASRPDDVVVSCRRAGTRLVRIDDDGRGRVPDPFRVGAGARGPLLCGRDELFARVSRLFAARSREHDDARRVACDVAQ